MLGLLVWSLAACSSGASGSGGDADVADVAGSPDPGALTASVDGGVLTLSLDGDEGDRLVFRQGEVEVGVPLNGGAVRIPGDVDTTAFVGLKPGPATWEVEAAGEVVDDGELMVTPRFMSSFQVPGGMPVVIDGLGGALAAGDQRTLSGTAGPTGLRGRVYVGRPSGPVDVLELDGEVAPGQPFSVDYTFEEAGTYAIELLAPNGLPAANVPAYVGTGVPLAPSVLDLPLEVVGGEPPVEQMDTEMMGLVNALRLEAGVDPVVPHPTLRATAQQKADDMATRLYFGHTDPEGNMSVGDLAEAQGLTGEITENIALEYNVERTFAAWYWSPSHRRALLDERWASHGLGVALYQPSARQLVLVQHFLSEPP